MLRLTALGCWHEPHDEVACCCQPLLLLLLLLLLLSSSPPSQSAAVSSPPPPTELSRHSANLTTTFLLLLFVSSLPAAYIHRSHQQLPFPSTLAQLDASWFGLLQTCSEWSGAAF